MDIEQHVNDFAEELYDGENRSTVDRYKRALRKWLEWLDGQEKDVWDATTKDLSNHLEELGDDGYANSYVNIRRAAVSNFYSDCAPDSVDNIADDMDKTWNDKSKKEEAIRSRDYWVDDDEFEDMLENVPGPKTRNIIVLKLLYTCGLRRGELAELRAQDVDEKEGVIRVYREKTDGYVHIPVRDGLMLELTRWRDVGRKTMGGYDPNADWLFPSERAERITGGHVNKIVKRAAEGAGMNTEPAYTDMAGRDRQKITAHSLRFSSAKALQDKGLSIDKIQTFLSHHSSEQTEHYLRGREKAMQDAVRDSFNS